MAAPAVPRTAASALEAALAAQRAFMDQWGDQCEQLLSALVYFVPVQDDSGDAAGFWSQSVYSIIDLFGLYRTVLLRSPEALPVALAASTTAAPDAQLRRARLGYTLAAFSLRVLRSLQVLIEMHTMRTRGLRQALRVCLRVEILKLLLKLVMRSQTPFSFYVDEDALEEVEPPKRMLGTQPGSGDSAESAGAPGRGAAYVGRRSGRTLRALGKEEGAAMGPPSPGCLLTDRTPFSARLAWAEALFHARPLLHLLALMQSGRRSWRPLVLAWLLDKASLALLAPALRPKPNTRAAALELAELRRRRNLLWWALARSPLFEKLFLRPAQAVDGVLSKIPVINVFRIVELMLVLQPFYFTTSAS